jgi:hypothetical protein
MLSPTLSTPSERLLHLLTLSTHSSDKAALCTVLVVERVFLYGWVSRFIYFASATGLLMGFEVMIGLPRLGMGLWVVCLCVS